MAFLRIVTTPKIQARYGSPTLSNREAQELLADFLAKPGVACNDEPPGVVPLWLRLADLPSASPKIWMDAYLAAFAIIAGLEFVTFDRGFEAYRRHGLDLRLLS